MLITATLKLSIFFTFLVILQKGGLCTQLARNMSKGIHARNLRYLRFTDPQETNYSKNGLHVRATMEYGKLWERAVLRCTAEPKGNTIQSVNWADANDGKIVLIDSKRKVQLEQPKYNPSERVVFGKFGHGSVYHEMVIHNPTYDDAMVYTCIIHNQVNKVAQGYVELFLTAFPKAGPWITYSNGTKINKTDCCRKEIVRIPADEPLSFNCSIGLSLPRPKVQWTQHYFANLNEEYVHIITIKTVKLTNVTARIDFQQSGPERYAELRCDVFAPHPKGQGLVKKELCLNLYIEKHQRGYKLWIAIQAGPIIAAVVFIPLLLTKVNRKTTDSRLKFAFHEWIKTSFITSAVTSFGAVFILAGNIFLEHMVVKSGLLDEEPPGMYTLIPHRLSSHMAITLLVIRIIINVVVVVVIHERWRPQEDKPMKYDTSVRVHGVLCTVSVFFGPGILYLCLMLDCLLQNTDARCRGGVKKPTDCGRLIFSAHTLGDALALSIVIAFTFCLRQREISVAGKVTTYIEGHFATLVILIAFLSLVCVINTFLSWCLMTQTVKVAFCHILEENSIDGDNQLMGPVETAPSGL